MLGVLCVSAVKSTTGSAQSSRTSDSSPCTRRQCGGSEAGSVTAVSASDAGWPANCLFRRLGKLNGDEVFFWIKIVLAGFVNHPNLVELCCRLIGNHLVKLP